MAVQELAAVAEEQQTQRSKGHLARAMARLVRKKIAVTCIVVLAVVYFAGIFAAWVSPYDYTAQDYTVIRKAPSYVLDQGPVAFWKESHFAGTDRAGRDVFTRVLWGIQNTVILTLVAMLTGGLLIGVSLGLIAGYYGKKTDSVIMRTARSSPPSPTSSWSSSSRRRCGPAFSIGSGPWRTGLTSSTASSG